MATGIDSYLNAYLSPYLMSYPTSGTSSSSSVFDYQSAQKSANEQAAALLNTYNSNQESVKTLKADTAKYLDSYALAMKSMGQSADKLRNDNLDKLLYDKQTGEVTDESVANTVKAVQTMVDEYNNTLKLLNDNADRGAGTVKQLGRMVTDPAPEASMAMVGVSVNKDGTLELDAEKMTEALKTTDANQLALYKDIIGGYGGIADGVHMDAMFGSNMSSRDLIMNDLANIQATQKENPFREMYESIRGNVYTLTNQAVTGMLMNLLV